MASKKKTHEELVKQINLRTEFADKLYKKMRSDRYGMTYCCPLDLEKINLKNDLCNWEHSKVPKLPEAYSKEILKDPNHDCIPPATFNIVTGMCEATIPATEVGTITYTYSDAIPNGIPAAVTPSNEWMYGKDCPIFAGNPNNSLNGAGNNAQLIGNISSWWTTYDASPTGPVAQQIPGVTEISFVNALAKAPPSGWPANTELSYVVPVNNTTPSNVVIHIFIASRSAFGLKLNGATKIDAINISTPANSLYNNGDFSGLRANIMNATNALGNISPALNPVTGTLNELAASNGKDCSIKMLTNPPGAGNPAANNWVASPYTRGYIYALRIDPGCNDIEISSWSDNGDGMLAFSIFSWEGPTGLTQGETEIVNSTQRSDLKELASSDDVNSFYSSIDGDNPWTCTPPDVLIPASGNNCALCQTEVNTLGYECPRGYTLQNTSSSSLTGGVTAEIICVLKEPLCDTETLVITVVNQNGEIWPHYEVIFDGGNYITDENGRVIIVVEDASVNTLHTFNLCECLTTSGGCAVQSVKITVTDPDVVDCVPNTGLPCLCVSPSFYSEVVNSNGTVVITFVDANFGSGTPITAVTYTFAYKLATETIWTEVTGLTADETTGQIQYTFTGLAEGDYEYKIKSVCEDESSSFSATNPFTVEPVKKGCMDPQADNYDPNAVEDNGTCEWYGCTTPGWPNFIAPAGPWTNPATGISGTVISNGNCNDNPDDPWYNG
tara:strand:+ start:620 stop:2794 length:2175 start_codon:yes stop_codon:yes gene_type:complete